MSDDAELALVHDAVEQALATGTDASLSVLGYGEISMVVGWPTDRPARAYKRLPRFSHERALADYRRIFDDYIALLADRGVAVVPSAVRAVAEATGVQTAYVVQDVLPPHRLAPALLREATPDVEHPVVQGIVGHVVNTVGPDVGLDAQLSNWAMPEGHERLTYFDVTTPMLATPSGGSRLDLDLFLAATPWAMRSALRRWVLPGILTRYHDPRAVLLDFAANLHKERLADWVPAVLAAANGALPSGTPRLTVDEVGRDYRSDARQWELLLRIRRADRWWQRTVRRRPYPFLLPGPIQR